MYFFITYGPSVSNIRVYYIIIIILGSHVRVRGGGVPYPSKPLKED